MGGGGQQSSLIFYLLLFDVLVDLHTLNISGWKLSAYVQRCFVSKVSITMEEVGFSGRKKSDRSTTYVLVILKTPCCRDRPKQPKQQSFLLAGCLGVDQCWPKCVYYSQQ